MGPDPIAAAEISARRRRVRRIAKRFGFTGQVEYRHVFSDSGGAQFGLSSSPERDLLVVFAEAFVRDANPADFSLDAIIAHERGHQVICRSERLQSLLAGKFAPATEEILASLVGSLIAENDVDRQMLVLKATYDAAKCGLELEEATQLVIELRKLLEQIV